MTGDLAPSVLQWAPHTHDAAGPVPQQSPPPGSTAMHDTAPTAPEAATGDAPATVPAATASAAEAAGGGERGLRWLTSDVDAPLMLANLRESMQARDGGAWLGIGLPLWLGPRL
jgi:hypothetical protein